LKKLKKLYREGLLTEKEVNEKFDILLIRLKEEREKENQEFDNEIETKRKREILNQLLELKEQGLLTETEFNVKKEQIQ